MQRVNLALMSLLSVSLFLTTGAGCSKGHRTGTASNSDVEQRVKEKFNGDPQLSAADLKVSANVDRKEIKLSGAVPTENERDKAMGIAQSVEPDFSITDTIDVKPREMARTDESGRTAGKPADNGPGDDWIRSQVQSLVKGDPLTSPDDISVDVSKGVVTLHGTVHSGKEKAQAQKMAEGVEGVTEVHNDLKIRSK